MKRNLIAAFLMIFTLCYGAAQAQIISSQNFQKLVIPGDFPDPSVIRAGNTYYATCSASEWGPVFTLMKSTNLVDWEIVNYVFNSRPKWSTANYWAPELYYDGKKFFIYYTGRIDGGPLCVAVATADRPEGPWTDHGPVVCQSAGSIDASCVSDGAGKKYLIWKEDGNSVGKPTPIWAQELSKSGIIPIGEKFELFHNDTPWEKNLVEAPFIMKKGEYFYCFYAGAGCCGIDCDYAVGVARSKSLKGKWEKFSQNPILAGNDTWKCPGHGTVVTDTKGNDIFMYHAYNSNSSVYVGRQALISQIEWGKDGWPVIRNGAEIMPLPATAKSATYFREEFKTLNPGWRWPVEHQPVFRAVNGYLELAGIPLNKYNQVGAVLAQATLASNYIATTAVNVTEGTLSGISCFGDINNAAGLSVEKGKLVLWKVERNQRVVLEQTGSPAGAKIQLKVIVKEGKSINFSYRTDGEKWIAIGPAVNGAFLPPWDRGVRVGLVSQGRGKANFDWFEMKELTKFEQ